MYRFGMLITARKNNIVRFGSLASSDAWKVVEVRDRATYPLRADTLRRRPENIRSRFYARLRNKKTGRIRTIYNAETVACVIGA